MPCDDCSRTESRPPCPNEEPKPCTCGPDEACGDPCTPVPEPPMTPEEEEEAPPDEDACDHLCECEHGQGDHGSAGHCKQCDCESSTGHYVTDCPEAPSDPGHDCGNCEGVDPDNCPFNLPPPEGPEYTPCVGCGHIEPEHDLAAKRCTVGNEVNRCGCEGYRVEQPPPQPERRAPYVASYSVQGHLYDLAIPGDASVEAVDGALVIRHGLGPVAGLVGFQPLTVEEK